MHKSGFVNIIGNPNVGKSTLMNALVGEKLSIITSKAQTTRHRILGIVNGDDFQIVFSDTPGILKPCYKLQESMLNPSLAEIGMISASGRVARHFSTSASSASCGVRSILLTTTSVGTPLWRMRSMISAARSSSRSTVSVT